jgi:hypothetical protein
MTKHFRSDEWVDFARGVMSESQSTAMQQHLHAGCADCASTLQTWKRIHEISRADFRYEPPESAVRTAKANFAFYPPRINSPAPAIARLLFDSLSNALPVGIRSAAVSARQMLFHAGHYEIDLRIEPQHDCGELLLVGQLLNSNEGDPAANNVPVSLVARDKMLAKSVTNSQGEFILKSPVKGPVQLWFEPLQGQSFCVPVTSSGGEKSLSGARRAIPNRRTAAKGKGPKKP